MAITVNKPIYKRVSVSNRFVIPASIMKLWNITEGDYLQISLSPNLKEIFLKPVKS